MGGATAIAPFASDATIVSCSPGESGRVAAKVVPVALHVSVAPVRPWKQATLPIAPGTPCANTRAPAASVGTPQSGPFTFQYSSSWSANALSAPSTVYAIR